MKYTLEGAQDAIKLFTKSTKVLLLIYFFLTILSLGFDMGSFISALKGFGKGEEDDDE